ncbi:hypothetical protein [Clostridium sp. JN-1]|uniref:hypothetical protein n=1 Tax=Clostridium sp. JN-1 TaxID=2483110 RepID=UPI001FAA40BB|nr:hypothetical protein [Clostridium sp. JN-1]
MPENEASYSGISDKMGCSKQNVKHIVINLEKKYVILEKNMKDKRAINIKITEDCIEIMKQYYDKGNAFRNSV